MAPRGGAGGADGRQGGGREVGGGGCGTPPGTPGLPCKRAAREGQAPGCGVCSQGAAAFGGRPPKLLGEMQGGGLSNALQALHRWTPASPAPAICPGHHRSGGKPHRGRPSKATMLLLQDRAPSTHHGPQHPSQHPTPHHSTPCARTSCPAPPFQPYWFWPQLGHERPPRAQGTATWGRAVLAPSPPRRTAPRTAQPPPAGPHAPPPPCKHHRITPASREACSLRG